METITIAGRAQHTGTYTHKGQAWELLAGGHDGQILISGPAGAIHFAPFYVSEHFGEIHAGTRDGFPTLLESQAYYGQDATITIEHYQTEAYEVSAEVPGGLETVPRARLTLRVQIGSMRASLVDVPADLVDDVLTLIPGIDTARARLE